MKLLIQMMVFVIVTITLSSCGYQFFKPPQENLFAALERGDCEKAKDLFLEKTSGMDKNSRAFNYTKFLGYLFRRNLCDDVIIELSTDCLGILNPEHKSTIYLFRARSWKRKGEYNKALSDYSKAVELNSKGAAVSNIAWFLATCPDSRYRNGNKAVAYAKKAVAQADTETPGNFSILAAADAEAVDFQEAITAQEKAIDLLKENARIGLGQYEGQLVSAKKSSSAKAIKAQEKTIARLKENEKKAEEKYEERIVSYKAGKAWREDPSKSDDEQ